jgi:hypothetical protein
LDHVALIGLDEGDDLHGPAALGAQERIDMVNLLDKHGPATAVEPGGVWLGGLRRWRAVGGLGNPLGADASGLVGVVAVIADEVLALVGDVLGEFGEEIERFEDMEVSGRAGE